MTAPAGVHFCPACGTARAEQAAYCEQCGRAFAPASGADGGAARAWVQAQRYIAMGETAAGERCLDTFEAGAGQSGDSLALRAVIRLRSADLEEARSLLDRALSLRPESPFVHVKNAEYWLALGLTTAARDELLRARSLAVGNDAVWGQVNRLLQSMAAKTRWSFVRGGSTQPSPSPDQSKTSRDNPTTPGSSSRRKGANGWRF